MQVDQKVNTAADFRDPHMYTSAWLMNSPTVIPMVTDIMAAPMSMPLPWAVIPPAADRPDYRAIKINRKEQNRRRTTTIYSPAQGTEHP